MFDALAKSYLQRHPAAAARSLSGLKGTELKGIFEAMPRSLAARVLQHMGPEAAGRSLDNISTKICADIVDRMDLNAAVSAIRHMGRDQSKALFAALPRHQVARVRLRLRYPETVVGSCVNTDVLTLFQDQHVGDALRLLRRSGEKPDHTLCVLDDNRHPVGLVDLSALLAARDRSLLRRIMRASPVVFHARDSLLSVENHSAWLTHDNLPVVNRNGSFQGMLPRSIVFEEETRLLSEMTEREERAVTRSALADIFWLGVSSLFPGKDANQDKGSK